MLYRGFLQKSWIHKLGILFILSSILIWILAPILIPFMPLTGQVKAISITTSLIVGEAIFWIGALMAGKEVANKIRKSLNPKNWKRKMGQRDR